MKIIATLLITLMAFTAVQASNITIKGSDTMVQLGQRWAEEFMKSHKGVSIQVAGGGSGTGIAALLNGTTDICEASRDMKPQEYKNAETKGIKPYRVAVALDGIAVFVPDNCPVKELSLEQLKGIYTGTITNWKDVGGPDHLIVIYGRENNSGTYAYFKEHVLNNEDYHEATQTLPGTAAVVNAVAKDKYGIGYGGLAWGKGVKFVAVKKDEKSAAVLPSVKTVTDGSYPIARDLYWFFNGTPSGMLKDLLNWILSPEGQKIAESADYIPLPADLAAKSILK